MSIIGSWIKTNNKCRVVRRAINTKSEYYTLENGITIRVSDHFKKGIDGTYDIQVVNSKNQPTVYLLQCEKCLSVYTFTCAEVKSFIKNYLILYDIRHFSDSVTKNDNVQRNEQTAVEIEKTKNCDETHPSEINFLDDAGSRTSSYGFCVFATALSEKFRIYKTFTPGTKKLVKRLASFPCTFDDIVSALKKCVTVNGKFNVEVFRKIVDDYEKVKHF